ncbi:hypothetical protein PIB30_099397 [Stylosanthes scabra]|uniref:Uncharacterized protein n=1 Tax=Stylosanthes scabra TaxID=79078 RepID=A0ABU6YYR4_9FABA|nr:hypothetical protein [Stylosanthes scabra]
MAKELIWPIIIANPTDPVYIPDHSQHVLPQGRYITPQCLLNHHNWGFPCDHHVPIFHDMGVPWAPFYDRESAIVRSREVDPVDPLIHFLTHMTKKRRKKLPQVEQRMTNERKSSKQLYQMNFQRNGIRQRITL